MPRLMCKKNFKMDASFFPYSIAPMMDRTDIHFRKLMRLITKNTLLYTEMINSNSIVYGLEKRFFKECETDGPVALQIGISDTKLIPKLSKIINKTNFSEININCGCPSSKVVNGKFGAVLMKTPKVVGNIISSLKSKTSKLVTVKTRIGIDNYDSDEFLYKFIENCVNNGADKIIIHARKAILKGLSPHENRTIPPLNYNKVESMKKHFKNIHFVLNGGIKSIEEGTAHLNHFDGIMIGRAAWDNPWIFNKIDNKNDSKLNIIINYLNYAEDMIKNNSSKAIVLRPIFNFFHGQNGSRNWKQNLNSFCSQYDSINNLYLLAEKIHKAGFFTQKSAI